MEISNVLDLISKYGVPLLLAALVIVGLYKVMNIGLDYLQGKSTHKNHDSLVAIRREVDLQIQMLINNALVQTGGTRIKVMEFHNSIANTAGLPFVFMSCNYEAYAEGLLPVSGTLKSISTSLYSVFMSSMQKLPHVVLDTENRDATIARAAYELVAIQNEHKSLCVWMKALDGTALGYVALNKEGEFSEADISAVHEVSGKISTLLSSAANK